MCGTGIVLTILLAAVSLQAAAARHAAPRNPSAEPSPALQTGRVDDLAPGSLLVASRHLTDPNFAQTVVVLLDHDEDGTLGLVVNRQTDVPLSRVFDKLPEAQSQAAPVYIGGPVAATAVQGLMRSPKTVAQARQVADDLYVIRTREPLEARLRGRPDPLRFRVYLGYAGWAPGQLAGEVQVGAWHIFPANVDAVFDGDPATLWDRKIRQTEVLLAGITGRSPSR
jgi:putative transcriptional regulator